MGGENDFTFYYVILTNFPSHILLEKCIQIRLLPAAQSRVPWEVQYFPGGHFVPAKQSLLEVDPKEFVVTPLTEQYEVQVLELNTVVEIE